MGLYGFELLVVLSPTGPKNLNFSTTSDSYFYICYGLFGGWKEANRRGSIQIGPYKLLKGAPKENLFFGATPRCAFKIIALI